MTKEEAIKRIHEHMIVHKMNEPRAIHITEALEMAIQALEQEDVLEKIRAKIEHLTYYWCEVNPKSVIDDVLEIIDKYKAESEGKK